MEKTYTPGQRQHNLFIHLTGNICRFMLGAYMLHLTGLLNYAGSLLYSEKVSKKKKFLPILVYNNFKPI